MLAKVKNIVNGKLAKDGITEFHMSHLIGKLIDVEKCELWLDKEDYFYDESWLDFSYALEQYCDTEIMEKTKK